MVKVKYALQLQWWSTFIWYKSSKFLINDYIFGFSSPFTINRRTASPANDWELMFGGAFGINMLNFKQQKLILFNCKCRCLSFAGDTGLTFMDSYTPYLHHVYTWWYKECRHRNNNTSYKLHYIRFS